MNDLIVVPQTNQWQKLKALVLGNVPSPITKRVAGLKNGELLRRAEEQFDLFITAAKNIRFQQNLKERRIAIRVAAFESTHGIARYSHGYTIRDRPDGGGWRIAVRRASMAQVILPTRYQPPPSTSATALATTISSSAGSTHTAALAPSAEILPSPFTVRLRSSSSTIPNSAKSAHTPARTSALFSPMPPLNVTMSTPPNSTRNAPR